MLTIFHRARCFLIRQDKENKKERTAKEKPQTGAIKEKAKERRGKGLKGAAQTLSPHSLQGKGPWWKLS